MRTDEKKNYAPITPEAVKRIFGEGVEIKEYPDRTEWRIPWRFSVDPKGKEEPLCLFFRSVKEKAYKARFKYDGVVVSDEGRVLEEWQKNHGDYTPYLEKLKVLLKKEDMSLVGGRRIEYTLCDGINNAIEHYLCVLAMLSQPDLLPLTIWWNRRCGE
jgi:hypothetical protein